MAKTQKQSHFMPGVAGFYRTQWHSTTGREARPALTRLAQFVAKPQSDNCAIHPLSLVREGTRKGAEVQKQSHFEHRERWS